MSHRNRHIAILLAAATTISTTACAQSVRSDVAPTTPDSLVLERTLCYGTCPAYRLSITRDGLVSFESRNPGEDIRQRDSVSSGTLPVLAAMADSLGFASLPGIIANSPDHCPDRATDHPTATVTIFRGVQIKQVVDYRGCYAASDHSTSPVLGRLRAFEASIDSLAGTQRWVKPARRR